MTVALPAQQLLSDTDPRSAMLCLTRLAEMLSNERGAAHDPYSLASTYVTWLETASVQLHNYFARDAVRDILSTTTFSALPNLDWPHENPYHRYALNIILHQAQRNLDDALLQLRSAESYWARPGKIYVTDTNFFIHYQHAIDDLPHDDFPTPAQLPIILVVPMAVIDELDALKRSRTDRVAARHAIRVLERALINGAGPTVVRQSVGATNSPPETTVEVLLDDPGHQRLPITDDEIVAVASRVQQYAQRSVTLLTSDRGAKLRAIAAGLQVASPGGSVEAS